MKIDDLRARAESGSVVAQSILGISYLYGYEVPQSYELALQWLTKAAARGASRPSAHLGTMYENGLGVSIDLARARELYEFAARREEYFGHLFLARFLASGRGGAVDERGATREYRAVREFADGSELEEAQAWLSSHPDADVE